jgi:CPA2 family monovalent cation:H+ antiporter-2
MTGFAILLVGAALAHAIARWTRIPVIPFLLIAGIALGRLGLLPAATLQDGLVLGLTFLLFVSGTELSPGRVREQRAAAVRVGVTQFLVLGGVGLSAAYLLGFDLLTSVYFGLALAASSTLLIVRLLQQRKQLFEPFGRLVVGVLLLQDLAIILFIPLLAGAPSGVLAVVAGFAGTSALVVLAYLCLRWVAPRLVAFRAEPETLLLLVLAFLFVFVGLADLLALPLAAGAFLAGVALSPFPVRGIIRGQLSSVADFFTAIFFLSLGGQLIGIGVRELLLAGVFALLVLLVTPPLVTGIALRTGFSTRPAVESGLLLAQTSEFSLVLALHGLVVGQISQEVFSILTLVTVATMMLTPFMATERTVRWLMRFGPRHSKVRAQQRPSGHILLLGCGTGGMPLLGSLLDAGEQVVVIDDDPEVVKRVRRRGVTCIRGDAAAPEVLTAAGAEHARLISSTIRRPRDNEALLGMARGVPVLVRVFEDEDAEWVDELGGTPILYSAAAGEDFLDWFATHVRATPPEVVA